jgi:8-hydroxy-5-deazaflavin:NADPH oxidoreductase
MPTEPLVITIAILGGTGKEGSGLAMRWANKGYHVLIGSRDVERAQQRAAEMNALLGGDYVAGLENSEAADRATIVVLSVPYSAHAATLQAVQPYLNGKILVDLTVPLKPPKVRVVHLPEGQAAALEAQAMLGPEVTVVAAFQNVSAEKFTDLESPIDCDVLICSDDEHARKDVMKLADAAGMRGVDAGPLANAIAVEALTPVLLHINRAYKTSGAGIRITGI